MSKRNTELWRETIALWWSMTRGYWWLPTLYLVVNIISMGYYNIIEPLLYKEITNALAYDITTQGFLENALKWFFIMFMSLFIIKVMEKITIYIGNIYEPPMRKQLQIQSLEYLEKHSASFFTNNMSGSIIGHHNDFWSGYVNFTNYFGGHLSQITTSTITVIGTIYLIFRENIRLGWIFLIYTIAMILMSIVWRHYIQPLREEERKARTARNGLFTDIITNMTLVKAFSQEEQERADFSKTIDTYNVLSTRKNMHYFAQFTIQDIIFHTLQAVLWYMTIVEIASGTASIGVFAMMWATTSNMKWAVRRISEVIQNMTETFSSAYDMTAHILQKPDITDLDNPIKCSIDNGKIEFCDVRFTYKNEGVEVFKNINIVIPAGQKVGIIGRSGSGKSTFAKLIMRFLEPTTGTINIDNQDISTLKQSELRMKIAYVPQENSLFHRSILDNMRYGSTHKSDAEVIEIAKKTYVDEFVKTLPNGYETLVGERGLKLSGGQKQRVAIGRAMLKDAPILLLDEATSALDTESERYIQLGFDALMADKTTIVIAHRLSTLLKMDRILVMEDGIIKEDDTLETLMNTDNSRFKQLWNSQKDGFLVDEDEVK